MAVQLRASVQYGDFTGTAAADKGDFESWTSLLGLDDWIILGMEFTFGHPPLMGDPATSSYGWMVVWGIERQRLGDGYHLPELLERESPVRVTEFHFVAKDTEYRDATDAAALMLRGAKRLSVHLWRRTVEDAGLDDADFEVTSERHFESVDGAWAEVGAG